MDDVICSCCGEVYSKTLAMCPLCNTENKNYVGNNTDCSECNDTVECTCCGEVYDAALFKCPLCGFENSTAKVSKDIMSNGAVLIDEDGEYVPDKLVKKTANKQNMPSSYLVLASFIGIIIIIISLIVGALSNVTKRESSKIGMDAFETHEYKGLQNE